MSKQIFSQKNRCTLLTNPLEKLVIFFNLVCLGFSIHEKFHGKKTTESTATEKKREKEIHIDCKELPIMGIKTVVAVVPHDKHIPLRHNLQKFNLQ